MSTITSHINIKPAQRLNGIEEYYFSAKLREIAELRAAGADIINLGIGSPDLPPAPQVNEALRHAALAQDAHGYQSYTGLPALRQAWAEWYQRHYGATLDAEGGILPLIGSKEGIMHLAMAYLEPGDIALAPDPGYPTYRAATVLAGAEVRYYALDAAQDWQPDWNALERSDLSKVKLMWLNYPHMPTGTPAADGVFEQAVAFGLKHNILIVNDNPYSFIGTTHPKSILAVPDAQEIALELNSLSKSHNMAGWRIGVLAGKRAHVQTVLRFKSNMDSGQWRPLQSAAIEALALPDEWYEAQNTLYAARRNAAEALLRSIGCRIAPGQQGLFVWAEVPADYADGYALSDKLLYAHQVFLTPGGIFGEQGRQFIRISLCADQHVIEKAGKRVQ